MSKEYLSGEDISFDIPALATAEGTEESPLEAGINSVTSEERTDSVSRNSSMRSWEVSKDITGRSTCTGVFSDFEEYFKDRFNKLKDILEKRRFDPKPSTVESIRKSIKSRGSHDVTLIGMIEDKWVSKNGYQMLELDDPTGSMRVVFTDNEVSEKCQDLLINQVVAVQGQVSDDGDIIFGDEIIEPDVPPSHKQNKADRKVKAVLISDTHFGSNNFAAEEWNDFVNWIYKQPDIEYILVSGDIVEGVGVYPGQKEELIVESVMDQYKIAAEAFKELPDDITIISSVGNHDSVRLAEPQPTLPEKFSEFFPENVHLVGNPAMANIEGVRFLLYHGMSFNPIIEKLGLDIHNPEETMIPLLKKRHLSPLWGEGVRIAPEEEDLLAIDVVPDFLHSGHVHTLGVDEYRDVGVVNSGCWQEQSDYQESKNVNPDVAYAIVVELSTGNMEIMDF